MSKVGLMFQNKQIFHTELIMAGEHLKGILGLLGFTPEKMAQAQGSKGKMILGTVAGDIHDVEKYFAKLFEVLKPGGGYLLSPALGIPDEAKPENVHTMIE